MSIVLIRSILLYILVILSVRLMGKRQLGELQPSEGTFCRCSLSEGKHLLLYRGNSNRYLERYENKWNRNRKKHQPLNSAVSFYSGGDEEDVMLIDTLEADELSKPESLMMYRYNIDDMNKKIEGRLSVYEKKVLAEYLTGDSYDTIAARLGKPEKSIDNAIQRIRKKLDQ